MPYEYEYPMNSAAATALIVIQDNPVLDPVSVVICQRKEGEDVTYPGAMCLPGAVMWATAETLQDTLLRAVADETGIVGDALHWHLFHNSSGPNDDPRGHFINACYVAHAPKSVAQKMRPGKSIERVWLYEIEQYKRDRPHLAFNHNEILDRGLMYWFANLRGHSDYAARKEYKAW
jgi:ADP-ribose pyrophosphatase YjhB (NUDIX family)